MGWNAVLLFFFKRWDYAAVLLKPFNCKWIDFWKAPIPTEDGEEKRCKTSRGQSKLHWSMFISEVKSSYCNISLVQSSI